MIWVDVPTINHIALFRGLKASDWSPAYRPQSLLVEYRLRPLRQLRLARHQSDLSAQSLKPIRLHTSDSMRIATHAIPSWGGLHDNKIYHITFFDDEFRFESDSKDNMAQKELDFFASESFDVDKYKSKVRVRLGREPLSRYDQTREYVTPNSAY